MRYTVVSCPRCGDAWAAESRHATSACPRCRTSCDLRRTRPAWTGDDAREAQAAAAHTRAAAQDAPVGILERPVPLPRHDSVLDAAASKAVGIANKSARAEAVALWLTRLAGGASRTDFVAALEKAGLDRDRSEAEVVRMLAMDILFEPKAGFYRVLQN